MKHYSRKIRFLQSALLVTLSTIFINTHAAQTTLISNTTNIQGNGTSVNPSISYNGDVIAFESTSGNLIGDNNVENQIYLKTVSTDSIQRISVSNTGTAGNAPSFSPSISDDGKIIVFYSSANNLVSGDTNGFSDIFVHDLNTNQTSIISSTSAGILANQESADAIISGDGKFVVFSSKANNLTAVVTNNKRNIYLKNISDGSISIISISSAGIIGDQDSFSPSISYDGRYIAFVSIAGNLDALGNNNFYDIYVHDTLLNTTERISLSQQNGLSDGHSLGASISADGQTVAYHSQAKNLILNDSNSNIDVFVYDRKTKLTERASAYLTPPDGSSFFAKVNNSGRFIAFYSTAKNLVGGDLNVRSDLFVYDRFLKTLQLESVSNNNVQTISNIDTTIAISGDGRHVAFSSTDAALVTGDTNGNFDVLLRTRDFTNLIPVAKAEDIPNQQCINGGAYVTLDATNSYDLDQEILSYNWSGSFGSVQGKLATVFLTFGSHQINLTVTDASGGTDTSFVTTVIEDTTPPTVNIDLPITIQATSITGAQHTVNYITSDNCEVSNVSISPSPSIYALGKTDVTVVVQDIAGLTTSDLTSVTVVDTIKPVLSIPSNIIAEATAINSMISVGQASATDIFPVTISNNAPVLFPLGNSFILWTATDSNGNISSATQTVSINDSIAPTLTVPTDIIIEASNTLTNVNLGSATTSDIFSVIVTNNAPASFPLGITSILWTAVDTNGNVSTAIQKVTVVDTTPPILNIPSNAITEALGTYTAITIAQATASDIFSVNITNNAPLTFPLGITNINWVATDVNGNSTSAIQTITVVDTLAPTFDLVVHKPVLKRRNHKLKYVASVLNIQDAVDKTSSIDIKITSNGQRHNKHKRRHSDWKIEKVGNEWRIWVRAEKLKHSKDDLVYTINVNTSDFSGNSLQKTAEIRVLRNFKKPHSEKHKKKRHHKKEHEAKKHKDRKQKDKKHKKKQK